MKDFKGVETFTYWEEYDPKAVKERKLAQLEALKAELEVNEIEVEAEDVTVDLEELKAEYEKKMGKKPFHGWSAKQIIEKMK